MEIGKELDKRIARDIMGLDPSEYPKFEEYSNYPESRSVEVWEITLPKYSTEIRAAFEIIDKLAEQGLELDLCLDQSSNLKWMAKIYDRKIMKRTHWECSEDPAHAICLAALSVLKRKSGGTADREEAGILGED